MRKNRNRGKKSRKSKNQRAQENLAMVPVDVNKLGATNKNNPNNNGENMNRNVLPLNANMAVNMKQKMNVNVNNANSNLGRNVKRVVSSKMYSSKTKNGKEETMVDILSGVTKNEKSRILRHFRLTQDGKKKSSTVLAKSNGKQIKVLESVHNGDKESVRKYKVKNPDEFKNVLSVQSEEIKGENMIRTMNLPIQKTKTKANKLSNRKSLVKPKRQISKKAPLQFKKVREALQKSLKSIMKPRPGKPEMAPRSGNQNKPGHKNKSKGDKKKKSKRNRKRSKKGKKS